jgi:hypothetical protein
MGQVIQIDEARIRGHLGEMVRGTVEETLNALLDAEADRLCGAGRYERSQARQDTRAGSYERTLQMCSPADASSSSLRAITHSSGSMWIATPSPCRTCTDYSLPVYRRTAKDSEHYPYTASFLVAIW